MPIWLDTLLARFAGRKVERHEIKIEINRPPGSPEERTAMTHEIEAEIARQVSEGNSPEVTRAAIEEIAERHGGSVKGFEDG